MGSPPPAGRTRLRIHPERAAPDEVPSILSAGLVAHVAVAESDGPVVIPMLYHFEAGTPDRLYLHGALRSRLLDLAGEGTPVCVTVTIADGLVYSRTALYHSMNYRSVVCFGRGAELTDTDEKRRLSEAMIGRYFEGRAAGVDYEPPTDAHLDATRWTVVTIDEASAKVRRGGPKGPRDDDAGAPGSAGVIDFTFQR